MKNLYFNKTQVLEKLRENRANHEKVFLEAQEGFKTAVIKELEERLEAARAGKPVSRYLNLVEPVNQLKDYDRAIAMLEMAVDEEVELDEKQFAQYMQDDWAWKGQFLAANAVYSHSLSADSINAESISSFGFVD